MTNNRQIKKYIASETSRSIKFGQLFKESFQILIKRIGIFISLSIIPILAIFLFFSSEFRLVPVTSFFALMFGGMPLIPSLVYFLCLTVMLVLFVIIFIWPFFIILYIAKEKEYKIKIKDAFKKTKSKIFSAFLISLLFVIVFPVILVSILTLLFITSWAGLFALPVIIILGLLLIFFATKLEIQLGFSIIILAIEDIKIKEAFLKSKKLLKSSLFKKTKKDITKISIEAFLLFVLIGITIFLFVCLIVFQSSYYIYPFFLIGILYFPFCIIFLLMFYEKLKFLEKKQ